MFNLFKPKFNLEKIVHTPINNGREYFDGGGACVFGMVYLAQGLQRPSGNMKQQVQHMKVYRTLLHMLNSKLHDKLQEFESQLIGYTYGTLTPCEKVYPEKVKKDLIAYLAENGYVSKNQLSSFNPTNVKTEAEGVKVSG